MNGCNAAITDSVDMAGATRTVRLLLIAAVLLVASGCSGDSSPGDAADDSSPPIVGFPPLPAPPIEPDCRHPAPLYGRPDPLIPDQYIVVLDAQVDAGDETARLAALYGFTPLNVINFLPGFSAVLEAVVVADLRCESTVEEIQFDTIVNPAEK